MILCIFLCMHKANKCLCIYIYIYNSYMLIKQAIDVMFV